MAIDFNGTPGEYTYSQGQYGKSAEGIVSVGAQSDRNPTAQQQAGGSDREAGDHGGHLIPHSLGGRNDESNLDAQAANVNQIDQRGAERNAASLAQDENNTVYMGVTNYTRDGSERPDATMITLGVMNNQTGSIDVETMSYTNANHAEHESWNDTALRNEGVDSRQDVGMTAEQRALANDLVGAEDAIDSRVGSGWTTTHFENNEYLGDVSNEQNETENVNEYVGDLTEDNSEVASEESYVGEISEEGETSSEDSSMSEDSSIDMD